MIHTVKNGVRIGLSSPGAARYLGQGGKLLDYVLTAMKPNQLQQLGLRRVLPDGTQLFASSVFGVETIRIIERPLIVEPKITTPSEKTGIVFYIDTHSIYYDIWSLATWPVDANVSMSIFIDDKSDYGDKGFFFTEMALFDDGVALASSAADNVYGQHCYIDTLTGEASEVGVIPSIPNGHAASSQMPYLWVSESSLWSGQYYLDSGLVAHYPTAASTGLNFIPTQNSIVSWCIGNGSHSESGNLRGFYFEIDTAVMSDAVFRLCLTLIANDPAAPSGAITPPFDYLGNIPWKVGKVGTTYARSILDTAPDQSASLDLDELLQDGFSEVLHGSVDFSLARTIGVNQNKRLEDDGSGGITYVVESIGSAFPETYPGFHENHDPPPPPVYTFDYNTVPYNVAEVSSKNGQITANAVGKRLDGAEFGVPPADLPF